MEKQSKRSLKKTTYSQFQKLVTLMAEYPKLANGSPAMGCSRAEMEKSWCIVARTINSIGPPKRNATEWKKIWADLKFRTKKAIADNYKYMNETEGNVSGRIRNLTPLELEIDRICHLSSAAGATNAEVQCVKDDIKSTQLTNSSRIITDEDKTIESQAENIPLATEESTESLLIPKQETDTSTPPPTPPPPPPNQHETPLIHSVRRTSQPQRKRKYCTDKNNEKNVQMKLLRQQVDVQYEMLDAMRLQAESAEASAEALQNIAESTKMMAKAMVAVAKHFTGVV